MKIYTYNGNKIMSVIETNNKISIKSEAFRWPVTIEKEMVKKPSMLFKEAGTGFLLLLKCIVACDKIKISSQQIIDGVVRRFVISATACVRFEA